MQHVLSYSFTIVIVYLFTYLSTRTLTQKAIAQMTSYELAGIMILANVAAEPLVNKVTTKAVYGTGLLVILMLIGVSLNELKGLLRQKGYDKISDLETIIMEPQGSISAFPKPENKPVRLKDLNIKPSDVGLTIPLIMDGSIIEQNLKHIRRDRNWILEELQKQGVSDYEKDVAIAEIDSSWNLIILKKY